MKNKIYNTLRLIAVVVVSLVLGAQDLPAQNTAQSQQTDATEKLTEVSGIVYDAATKQILPGVRIEALGNNKYTAMTKTDGMFSMRIPDYVTSLFVSTPGYEGLVVKADKDTPITIYMYDEAFSTFVENEFNVTGKSEANINVTKALSLETEIQNQLGADVRTITRSGTIGLGSMMMMQGISSLNTSAQPLIVLDGIVQDLQDSYTTLHDGYYNNVLAGIDVNDIEKITVLKNATALYGAKGGNGVILVDTKRGHSQATRIDASAYATYALAPKLPQMMNASQFRIYANELMGGVKTEQTDFPFLSDDKTKHYYAMYHNDTDWSDYVYQNAIMQNYHVNVQGGDERAMYNFSVGFADGDNTIKNNDFNRLNIRFNTDIVLAEWLDTRFDISYSRVNRDLRDDGIQQDLTSGPIASPGFLALIKAPFLSPYRFNSYGNITQALDGADTFANIDYSTMNNSLANPLTIFEHGEGENKNIQEYTVFDVTVAPEARLGKGLTATTLFNYRLHRANEKYFRPMTGSPAFLIPGLGLSENEVASFFSKETAIYSDTHIDWTRTFGKHYINAFGGFRFSNFAYDSSFQSCHNTGNDKLPDISEKFDYIDEGGELNVVRNMAWYANIDYSLQNKYFLQASLTAESSSRFGKEIESALKIGGVCWGLFPSIQAGWLVSSEPFFNTKTINYLKLRGGVDWSGNDNINSNAAYTYFGTVQYSGTAMGIKLANIENQSLQWETTRRVNLGFDVQAFNNRVRLSGDIFHNTTNDLLTLDKIPYLTGLQYYWCNGGSLQNDGASVNLTVRTINKKNLKWEVGVSAGTYKNKITQLPTGTYFKNGKNADLYGFTTDIYNGTILSAEGMAAGVFYGYETDGVYKDAEEAIVNGKPMRTNDVNTGLETTFEAGDVKFVDQNGDNFIDENDRVVIGNPNPELFGNIHSNLKYKNFTLSATLNYSLGNDVYNYQRSLLESGSNFYNQTVAVVNRWKADGDITDIPRATYGDPKGNNRFSDRWIEDGSYLRLKDVTLSYQVPVSASWLQGLSVWCSATNLLTLTKYLGSDPEFSFSNNVLYQGIDNGMLGQGRSFNIGVKVNL